MTRDDAVQPPAENPSPPALRDAGVGLDPEAERTLDHMRLRGLKENTARAIASDLRYIAAWCFAYQARALPMPTPPELVEIFIAHHLWDPAVKAGDPTHGMPDWVADILEERGLKQAPAPGQARRPAATSTVRRRLASLSTWHRWHRDLRRDNPVEDPDVKAALAAAAAGSARIREDAGGARVGSRAGRKSEVAVVAEHLLRMAEACRTEAEAGTRDGAPSPAALRALRDRALLLCAWSSGGRRRSEIAGLSLEQLRPAEGGYLLSLGATKTRTAEQAERREKLVPLMGSAARALDAWLAAARVDRGRVFRGVDPHGNVSSRLSADTVNRIVKERAVQAGVVGPEDASRVSAHGLRAGFLTEAARRRMPVIDAMSMSDHRSERSVAHYWEAEEALRNPCGGMLDGEG